MFWARLVHRVLWSMYLRYCRQRQRSLTLCYALWRNMHGVAIRYPTALDVPF